MGFGCIFNLIDNAGFFWKGKSIGRDLVPDGPQHYLLIDASNVSFCDVQEGGPLLNSIFVDCYWRAIINSGFKQVLIVKDGKHDALRGVKKLIRMLDDLQQCMNYEIDANSFLELDTSSSIASQQKKTLQRGNNIKVVRALQEADSTIRTTARELINKGNKVTIMTNDASLILGVPSSCSLFSPSRCSIIPKNNNSTILHGPLVTVQSILDVLNDIIFDRFAFCVQSDTHRLNASSLCLVAALCGGEEDHVTPTSDPHPMVKLVSDFLFNPFMMTDASLSQSKIKQLIAASLLVITASQWKWGDEIKMGPNDLPNPFLYVDIIGPITNRCIKCAVETKKYKKGFIPTIFSIKSVAGLGINKVCGDVSVLSEKGILATIQSRLNDSMDVGKAPACLYRGLWGKWGNTYEPLSEHTGLLLKPAATLYEQVRKIMYIQYETQRDTQKDTQRTSTTRPPVKVGESSGTSSSGTSSSSTSSSGTTTIQKVIHVSSSSAHPTPSIPSPTPPLIEYDSVGTFNEWLESIWAVRRNDDDDDDDHYDDNVNWEDEGSNYTNVKYWKSFKLDTNSDHLQHAPQFTTETLVTYVQKNKKLPSIGRMRIQEPMMKYGKPQPAPKMVKGLMKPQRNKQGKVVHIGMAWEMKDNERDFDRHKCQLHSPYKAGGGALVDLHARHELLESLRRGEVPHDLILLDIAGIDLSLGRGRQATNCCSTWWQEALAAQANAHATSLSSTRGGGGGGGASSGATSVNSAPSLAARLPPLDLDTSAMCMLALVKNMMVCLHSTQPPLDVEAAVEAALLSPLFAKAALGKVHIFGHTLTALEEQVQSMRKKWDAALKRASGVIGVTPVGSLQAIRWTALASSFLNSLPIVPVVPTNYVNAAAKADCLFSMHGWFDPFGFCVVLRCKEQGLHVLDKSSLYSLLGLGDAQAELMRVKLEQVKSVVLSCLHQPTGCALAPPLSDGIGLHDHDQICQGIGGSDDVASLAVDFKDITVSL